MLGARRAAGAGTQRSVVTRRSRAPGVVGLLVAACAGSTPGFEAEVALAPLAEPVEEIASLELAALGYEVHAVQRRSTSSTLSALKIRSGPAPSGVTFDWLHVTIMHHRIVTQRPSRESARGEIVHVRAVSEEQARSRRVIQPTAQAIADALAFIEAMKAARGPPRSAVDVVFSDRGE